MPYIRQADRPRLDGSLPHPRNAGELNYLMTRLAHQYWSENGANYQAFNDVDAVREFCELESKDHGC